MRKEQNQIKQFMVKAGQETPDKPAMPDYKVRELRVKLIAEELLELAEALNVDLVIKRVPQHEETTAWVMARDSLAYLTNEKPKTDMVEAYDGIIDLLVVVIGTAVAMGLDIDPGWEEVHRTNMAKFAPGGHRREDGKWIKPPGWKPPQLKKILQELKAEAKARKARR